MIKKLINSVEHFINLIGVLIVIFLNIYLIFFLYRLTLFQFMVKHMICIKYKYFYLCVVENDKIIIR